MIRLPPGRDLVLGVLVPVVTLAAAGVGGGAIWVWWADPPADTELTRTNAELLLGEQFAVDASYAVTGLAVGFVAGLLLAWLLRRSGWLLVVGVSLGGGAAAAVSYGLGLGWGAAPVDGSERGDLLSGAMSVHVPGVFLLWPVGALLGLMLVVWLADRADDSATDFVLPDLPPVRTQ